MRFAIKSKLFLHYGIIPCRAVHVNSSYHATLQYTKMSKIGTQRKCQPRLSISLGDFEKCMSPRAIDSVGKYIVRNLFLEIQFFRESINQVVSNITTDKCH